jgi:hypothetical protein
MHKTLQVLNILGFLTVLILNGLANGLPLNGYTTGELSDMYPNLFTPAGFTFSIWGLIYLALAGFIVFQTRSFFNNSQHPKAINLIGMWFFISCLANSSWIVAWHYQHVWLSVLLMGLLLFSLITIYRNLGIGIREVAPLEKWLVHAPFSLYLGWISVATIANITAFLVELNFNGWGLPAPFYVSAMLIVTTLLGMYMLHKNFDWVYVLVLLWAFCGIYYKRTYGDTISYPIITTTLAGCAFALLATIYKNRNKADQLKAYP